MAGSGGSQSADFVSVAFCDLPSKGHRTFLKAGVSASKESPLLEAIFERSSLGDERRGGRQALPEGIRGEQVRRELSEAQRLWLEGWAYAKPGLLGSFGVFGAEVTFTRGLAIIAMTVEM